MLKWLKSTENNLNPAPEARPPWIQKISVAQTTQNTEREWQSRLAEKMQTLRKESPQRTPVAGKTEGQNFAFHLIPLDSLDAAVSTEADSFTEETPPAATTQTQASEEVESASPARGPEVVGEANEERTPRYAYTLDAKPMRDTHNGAYELSHSTVDYSGGDAFDLENLFDDAGGAIAAAAWSAPSEVIDELSDAPAQDKKTFFTLPNLEPTPTESAFEESEEEVIAAPIVVVEKPAKIVTPPAPPSSPPAKSKNEKIPSGERASVTPYLQINRQRELLFPLLKTQKRAHEFANPAEAQHVIEKLEETLDQFSIEGHVVGIQRGPIITRYELKMAAGIKVNRILALTDELAMALEALRVRIEAPIPGRSTVGIEIPNKQRIKVLLGDILNDAGYRDFGGELPLPLGRDIAGNLLLEDLTRMPHLLIAGATGSGKSVAVNSFISSLILHKSPEEVRFLLVDPKLVELSGYNDIPHLLHPVITEPNKAILALGWAVEEMERRYEDLAEMGARDIRSYNEKIRAQKNKSELPIMPYIVVLIDELGDLMMVAGKEVENSIIRLSQKARAVGIHLILATQRPSVDVITALIKANCPARIALQVAQKTDSRTILDGNGAEQLLGQGDMLFRHPSKAQLIRAQVPLIEDNEVEDIVNYAKKLAKPVYITLEDPKGKLGEIEAGDEELFDESWQIILESQKASASYLQRRLRIGYNKAARLIEAFEARGMIGPQIGSKPREIIGTGQGGVSRVP